MQQGERKSMLSPLVRIPYLTMVQGICMSVILFAAITKLIGRADFEADLIAWDIANQRVRESLSLAIPLTELMIALAWLLRISPAAATYAAALMLIAFSAAYANLWAQGRAPNCGCFGGLMRFQNAKSEAPFVLIRNTALIAGLVVPQIISSGRAGGLKSIEFSSTDERARAIPAQHGFTLIETLLSISLIAILIALCIPSLSKVRGLADRSRSIQTLGTLAKSFASYTSDFRDYMPYFTDPKATYSVVYHDGIGMQIEYFGAYYTWHIALGERSFDAPPTSPVYYTLQEQPRHGFGPTSFWYSASFLADPAYWKMETRIGPEQWRSTRLAEVIFPSSKALLLDSYT
jgi:prepilin-type N-terminal cleavage/methylation domain-containing protein